MGTRSSIARKNTDGSITSIYCHWDGYISHNGRILKNHYSDPQKVDALLGYGDASSLGEEIGEQHEFDNPHPYGSDAFKEHADRHRNWCKFYGRDRNETDVDCGNWEDVKDWLSNAGQEFNYLFVEGVWFVNRDTWQRFDGAEVFEELAVVLEKEAVENE